MAPPSELSLDCKQHQSNSMLLKYFGEQSNTNDHQSQKLEEFLARLEEEKLKIGAFTRELPLCMQLLTNAVETYRQQLQSYKTTSAKPVFEEFIPLKNGNFEGSSEKVAINMNMPDNKENWMTSAQLWVQTAPTDHENGTTHQQPELIAKPSFPREETKQRSNKGGGAFLPFTKERRALPELTLASSDDKEIEDKKIIASDHHAEQGKGESQITIGSNNITTPSNTTQTHRKARRCWSPDLHRRFVNALQMLGGSQVATPKQIRELMQVDSLTNDEVKSHLQKYRLHTRRPISPNPIAAGSAAGTPQLVVLGGIWVPEDYGNGGGAATLYGASKHHPTTHYCGAMSEAHDLYSSPQAQSVYHQVHMFRAMPTQANGSESIEDGKSESGSWKADSGDQNAGERKTLLFREDGEESDGIGVR